MAKSVLVILIVLLLVGGIGGVLYFTSQKSGSGKPSVAQTAETPSTIESSGSSTMESLKNLMLAGKAVSCTYTDSQSQSQGTVKVADGKVRGDFTTETDGQSVNSHMISDSKQMYMWSDAMAGKGLIYNLDQPTPEVTGTTSESASSESAFDMNKTLDYQCQPWTVDSSVFTPPTDVEFSDMSNLVKSMMPTGIATESISPESASGNSAQCAACNSLAGEAKTQCLSALNCN